MPADGNIINFPGKVFHLPTQPEETIWFSAGSLHASYGSHVRHMDVCIALERRLFWARECVRLGCDPTQPDARHAAKRWMEITTALDALANHNRIVGKPSPYPPEHVREMLAASLAEIVPEHTQSPRAATPSASVPNLGAE